MSRRPRRNSSATAKTLGRHPWPRPGRPTILRIFRRRAGPGANRKDGAFAAEPALYREGDRRATRRMAAHNPMLG